MKEFNTTGVCIPEKHYMVDISEKLAKIEKMVDKGKYFTVNFSTLIRNKIRMELEKVS